MATLTISISSGAGTTSNVSTFSAADATRILTVFKTYTRNDAATQQTLTDYLGGYARSHFRQMVDAVETVEPTPPAFS